MNGMYEFAVCRIWDTFIKDVIIIIFIIINVGNGIHSKCERCLHLTILSAERKATRQQKCDGYKTPSKHVSL